MSGTTQQDEEILIRSTILFLDWRDIQCGRLDWCTSEGERLGVGNPRGSPVPLYAHPHQVPRGIRLEAQPATTEGPVTGWIGLLGILLCGRRRIP